MKFNINNYEGSFGMHCKTEKEANDFCDYMHRIGKKWCSGCTYDNHNNWKYYGKNTVYYFNEGSYDTMCNARINGYIILEWSDFMKSPFTKADLKTGDVIQRRNGWIEIVNLELKMLIRKSGWNNLETIRGDLTDINDAKYDIIAVRRPINKGDCQFGAFEYNFGDLIYDRERDEVEELTLAEVCKLLGKNIKIIQ